MSAAPNPARHVTHVTFAVTRAGAVRWGLYDVLGRQARADVWYLPVGTHSVSLDVGGLAPGLYILRVMDVAARTQSISLTVRP